MNILKVHNKNYFSAQTLIMAIVFVCLLIIQIYFLVQTYSLEKKEIYENVRDELASLNKKVLPFVKEKDTMFLQIIKKYYKKEEDITNLKKRLIRNNVNFAKNISKELECFKNEHGIDIAYCKEIKQITFFDDNSRKPLLNSPLLLFKNKALIGEKLWNGSSTWNTEEDTNESKLHFNCESNDHFSVNNIQILVFKKIIILIFCSFLLLMFVLLLFYKSINNLKNKKIIINNQQEIINNIAHELKTPLASLTVAIKTMGKMDLNDKADEVLKLIDRQKDRFGSIVNQINFEEQFSITSDEVAELNISKWTEDYVKDKEFEFENISFQTAILPDIVLKIKNNDLQTLVTNLLGNSIKYGASQIKVSLEKISDEIILVIHDDGVGVSKYDSEFIFDKYYRAQKGNTYETKGLGLGLYYVLKTLQKYNGSIKMKSLNSPTIFEVCLPVIKEI